MNTYDVANWRTMTPAQYAEAFANLALGVSEPDELTTKIEALPDGRIRLVTLAEVKTLDEPAESTVDPFLMLITSPETGATVCFRRTDRLMAL